MNNLVWSLISICLVAAPVMADHDQWRRAMAEAGSAKQEGRFSDAVRAYDEAVKEAGPDETLILQRAIAVAKRASVFHDVRRTRDAEKGYLESIAVLRRQSPEAAQQHLIPVVISLAALYLETNQPSKAVALKVDKMLPDMESPAHIANAYSVLGSIAFAQGRLSEAEALWLRSLKICEDQKNVRDTAVGLSNLGLAASKRNDFRAAAAYFQRSVNAIETSVGLEHPIAVTAQSHLGQALFRIGRYGEATEWLDRAHGLARKWYGDENVVTVQLCLQHAEALRKSGRKDEAKALMARVRRLPAAVMAALPGRSTVDVLALQTGKERK